ncbi:MAG: UvrD-helicase domain-containing protein [Candidatus Velamenicoccus archaeovorus]
MAPHHPFEPDPAQQQVLEHARGALLVEGAAGTGKSAVLRERFARLIEQGADPERVVLVVRSRHDRAEARRRLLTRLGRSLPDLRVTTVQGVAHQVMARRFAAVGYREPPRVLDAADQFATVQELLRGELETRREEWPAYGALLGMHGFADEVRQFLLRAQEALMSPDDVAELARSRALSGWLELAGFYGRYLDALAQLGSVDFAGLVWQAANAARDGERLFEHVLVDDFQDTTLGAEALLAALDPTHLVVAGDLDAHVFSFQGTTDVPLRRFAERFGAGRVRLREPHRGRGVTVEAWRTPHVTEEHAVIARELRRVHVEEHVPWDRLAVIVRRQGPYAAGLIRSLDDAGIPRTSSERGLSLATASATRPYVLALRWIASSPERRDDLIEPVLTSELGNLSPASARALLRLTRADGRRPREALDVDEGLTEQERSDLATLRDVLSRAEAVRRSVLDAFAILWKELPCSARLVAAAETDHEARVDLDGVLQLARMVTEAGTSPDPSVEAFLQLAEVSEGGPGTSERPERGREAVEVLTAHAAAGRGFDTVVIADAVEGTFPSLGRPEPMFDPAALRGSLTRSEQNRLRLEDERRLFRSALHRASRRVVVTASDPHGLESDEAAASRFVEELGVGWREVSAEPVGEPVSSAEAAAAWRRTLGDRAAPAPARAASLSGLLDLGDDPSRWWFQRDWSGPAHLPREELRLSYSRLDHLENCELQFVLADELGLDVGGGYQAWVGHLVHRLIEDVENGKVERTPEAFVRTLNARWQPARFPSYAVSEAERQHVIDIIVPNWFRRFGDPAAEATEERFRFSFEGAVINGVIDRIGRAPEGGRRITDYKTGNADNAPRAAESLQLGIYYLAVSECEELADFRPVEAVELSYLAGTKRKGELVNLEWTVSEHGEERYEAAMRERLSGLVQRVRRLDAEGRYVASTSANCFFCRFQTLCSRYPEGGEVFPIPISLPREEGDVGVPADTEIAR